MFTRFQARRSALTALLLIGFVFLPCASRAQRVDPQVTSGNIDMGSITKYPTIASAISALPEIRGYRSGTINIPPGLYTITSTITASPFVSFVCAPGAIIDYQGTGVGFLFTTEGTIGGFNYAGTGGLDGCHVTNSTNNAAAIVEFQNVTDLHLKNTLLTGGGTGTSVCMLFDNDGPGHYTEQSRLDRVYFLNCATSQEFEVTNGGRGSFAYTRESAVTASPAVGGTAGTLLLNNAQLIGGDLEINSFMPDAMPAFWMRDESRVQEMSGLKMHYELTARASFAIGIKTDTGTLLLQKIEETSSSGRLVADSFAAGTYVPLIWNYKNSGLSAAQPTPKGLMLIPNGTAAGYACGNSCGSVDIDSNTQTAGTFPHVQAPPNLGNTTNTISILSVTQCGRAAVCSPTVMPGKGQIVTGTIPFLASRTASVKGMPAFTSGATYNCSVMDPTHDYTWVITAQTATGFTIIAERPNSDAWTWTCVGY